MYTGCTLDVHSSDTDVLVLLIRYCDIIPSSTRFLRGSQKDPIMIKSVSEKLGNERCKALTALHAISGTDVTGSFYGKTKASAWVAFQKASSYTVQALISLTTDHALGESSFKSLEGFVCSMYDIKNCRRCTCSREIQTSTWNDSLQHMQLYISTYSEIITNALIGRDQSQLCQMLLRHLRMGGN